jgi:hypothetical protein
MAHSTPRMANSEFGRLHDWKIGWLLPFENAGGVDTGLPKRVGNIWTVANKSAVSDKVMSYVTRGYFLPCHHRNNLGATIVKEWIGTDHELCVPKTSHGDFRVKGQKESSVHE